jgi:hypothetical protein
MKKVFISQPMRGLTDEQILEKRDEIKKDIESKINEEIEFIDSFLEDYPGEINKHIPVWYLGKSIQLLSQADMVYFGEGWGKARGCKIEYQIAKEYLINIIGC